MENNELEKELFKHFEQKKLSDIPLSTQNTIKHAFDKTPKNVIFSNTVRKIIYIFYALVFATGLVCAKDIANFITPLFSTTTNSINTAVENGYVQNVNMDFVYDKDIGIKINHIILDDYTLDMSLVYTYTGNDAVSSIELMEYSMKNENDDLLYKLDEDNYSFEGTPLANTIRRSNKLLKLNDNQLSESILFGSYKFPVFENIFLHIKSVRLNKETIVYGNWDLNLKLDNKFCERNNIIYKATNDERILNCTASLSETSLKMFLELKENFNKDYIFRNPPQLVDQSGKTCISEAWGNKNIDDTSIYHLEFHISKYYENIDELNVTFYLDENKPITITLVKQ